MSTDNTPGAGNVELMLFDNSGREIKFVLKPTLGAAMAISRQTGGIRGAINAVTQMDLDTISSVIRLGIGDKEAKRHKNIDQLVFENGLMDSQGQVLSKIVEFLSNLARGGRPAPEEDEDHGDPTMRGQQSDPN